VARNDLRGVAQPATRWTGLFTVATRQPRTEEQLRANPLGLLLTSFQWSRDL
jgi:type IV secretory pathway TrbF-like protein